MSGNPNFWKQYHQENIDKSFPSYNLIEIIKSLNISSVLEIGCGLGQNLCELYPLKRVGIDISDFAISKAKIKYPDIDFFVGNILDTEFKTSFDLVYTCYVIEHIKPEFLPQVFQKMYNLSNRYILNFEAYDDTEHEINWHRGQNEFWTVNMAERWKRFPVKIIKHEPGPNPEYWITLVEKV